MIKPLLIKKNFDSLIPALGISKMAPSRLAYELAKEPFLIQDLRFRLQLPSTKQAEETLLIRQRK